MSMYQFIAADHPLPEIENPHVQLYSINEAIAAGIKVEEDVLALDIDPDEPEVLLWFEDEELLGEITLKKEEYNDYSKPYTTKPYRYTFEWGGYKEERAVQLVTFLQAHLSKGSAVEIWETWMDEVLEPERVTCSLKELSTRHIKELFGRDGYEKPTCLLVTNEY